MKASRRGRAESADGAANGSVVRVDISVTSAIRSRPSDACSVRLPWLGKGHAGEAADRSAWSSAYLDRRHAARADPRGDESATAVVATMQSGALVPDEVVNRMVEERLSAAGLQPAVLCWMAIRGRWSRRASDRVAGASAGSTRW